MLNSARLKRNNFFVIKLHKLFLPCLFLVFTFCLLIFSKSNLPAVKDGLNLWVNSVVPSLFPFFVATELLMHTNITHYFGLLFKNIMKPLFNVDGKCSFAFLMGIISGYPVGAKIACEFRKQNICSKVECERLLSFTNNSGPLFIIGSVGISMFGNVKIGILLLVIHLLACITVGFLFSFWKAREKNRTLLMARARAGASSVASTSKTPVSFSNLGTVLTESIASATSTIFMIGGFIVVFACIISIFNSCGFFTIAKNIFTPLFNTINIDPSYISPIISGFIELTGGLAELSQISIINHTQITLIIASFLLGFGGISVLLQVWSIVSKTDLSIKPYIIGKLLHGTIAAIYTFVFLQIFNFNL